MGKNRNRRKNQRDRKEAERNALAEQKAVAVEAAPLLNTEREEAVCPQESPDSGVENTEPSKAATETITSVLAVVAKEVRAEEMSSIEINTEPSVKEMEEKLARLRKMHQGMLAARREYETVIVTPSLGDKWTPEQALADKRFLQESDQACKKLKEEIEKIVESLKRDDPTTHADWTEVFSQRSLESPGMLSQLATGIKSISYGYMERIKETSRSK